MMHVKFICGCGMENHTLDDWVAHWKYGTKGRLYAIKLFLTTKIVVCK